MKILTLEMKYGLFCALALSVWVLIEFFLGFHTNSFGLGQYSSYFSIIIPIAFIFVALREKQSQTNGILSVKDGINLGFKMALISSLVFTIFLYLYNNHINPNWIENMIEWQRKRLIIAGANDDEIGKFIVQNRYRNSILAQGLMNFINLTGIGVIITLIEISLIKLLLPNKNS